MSTPAVIHVVVCANGFFHETGDGILAGYKLTNWREEDDELLRNVESGEPCGPHRVVVYARVEGSPEDIDAIAGKGEP